MGLLDGKVAIVTGAGRGIGRGEAIELAAQGASVVVGEVDGDAGQAVVDEITKAGGAAVVHLGDCSEVDAAQGIVQAALSEFGRLDALVNNAGILRDRTLAKMTPEEWDAVIKVHLRGHYAPTHAAINHWRDEGKPGHVVCTASTSGILGNFGQSNYGAAKAGIAAFTRIAAMELGRYGVTVNAIAPSARTRMTATVFAEMMAKPEEGFDAMAPENISPLVVWLGSAQSRDITGKVFEVEGGIIRVAEGWAHGPQVDKGARWDPAELGPVVADLLAKARRPVPVYGA